MLYETDVVKTSRTWWTAALVMVAGVCGSAAFVRGAVADHRVSQAEVERMAADATRKAGFAVLGDAGVTEALNALVATPEARERHRAAFARLPALRPIIEGRLQAHGVPTALLALAMFESSLDRAAVTANTMGGSAGVWQFIPKTARAYGLRVDEGIDERLDITKDSEAAAVFLADLYRQFGDWVPAIAAYNIGPPRVRAKLAQAKGISAREALPPKYVSGVMATVLLLQNPSLID